MRAILHSTSDPRRAPPETVREREASRAAHGRVIAHGFGARTKEDLLVDLDDDVESGRVRVQDGTGLVLLAYSAGSALPPATCGSRIFHAGGGRA